MNPSSFSRPQWLAVIVLLLVASFVWPRAYAPSVMVTPFLQGMATVGLIALIVRPTFLVSPAPWLFLVVVLAWLGPSTNELAKWALASAAVTAWIACSIGAAFGGRQELMRAGLMAVVLGMLINVLVAWLQFFDIEGWFYPFVSQNAADRPYGSLRQPNHLATFCVLGLVSLWWAYKKHLLKGALLIVGVMLAYSGIALSGSRIGIVEVAMLSIAFVVWLGPNRRFELLLFAAAPLWVLGMTEALNGLSSLMDIGFQHVKDRGGESVSTRLTYWREAWSLASKHPTLGVGWGEFGKARFFEEPFVLKVQNTIHAHNLVLHLLAELGFASTFAILAPIAWVLISRLRVLKANVDAQWAILVVSCVGLHSLVEYPLWYMNFIVPTAFAFGLLLTARKASGDTSEDRAVPRGVGMGVSALLLLVSCLVLVDYVRVASAFQDDGRAVENLDDVRRIQNTPLFRHYADRALVERVPLSEKNAPAMLQVTDRLLLAGPNPIALWIRLGALCNQGNVVEAQELARRYEKVFPSAHAEFMQLNDQKKMEQCGLKSSARPIEASQ